MPPRRREGSGGAQERNRFSRSGCEEAPHRYSTISGGFEPGFTSEEIPTFEQREFLLGAKRSLPRCRLGAMRRNQNGADYFSGRNGISEGRRCWRTRQAHENAPASDVPAIRRQQSSTSYVEYNRSNPEVSETSGEERCRTIRSIKVGNVLDSTPVPRRFATFSTVPSGVAEE